jgi:hypothetical protein
MAIYKGLMAGGHGSQLECWLPLFHDQARREFIRINDNYMNREIKFRGWDARSKRMGMVLLLEYNTDFPDVIERVVLWPYDIPIHTYTGKNVDKLILMQYTGLKDGTKWVQLTAEEKHYWELIRNGTEATWSGKDIYEGDIVRTSNGNIEVKWDEWSWSPFYDKEYGCLAPNTEVIGNIYETLNY